MVSQRIQGLLSCTPSVFVILYDFRYSPTSLVQPSGVPIKYDAGTCRFDATARLSEMVSQQVFENDADRAVVSVSHVYKVVDFYGFLPLEFSFFSLSLLLWNVPLVSALICSQFLEDGMRSSFVRLSQTLLLMMAIHLERNKTYNEDEGDL